MENKCILAIALLGALSPVAKAQSYTASEVSPSGFTLAIAGGTVFGYSGAPAHAARWDSLGHTDLHPAGYASSYVRGARGSYAVGNADRTPMVWRGNSATPLPVPFAFYNGLAYDTDGTSAVGVAYEGDPERTVGAGHALLWNLNSGSVEDLGKNVTVSAVGGGVQVGYQLGSKGTTAAMWRGTAKSVVNLHVRSQNVSVASGTDGLRQVGYVGLDVRVRNEAKPRDIRFYSAVVWTGSAASVEFLPSPYRHSFATTVLGDTVVGYGNTTNAIGNPIHSHAIAWVGTSNSPVDLHALLPANMLTSRATDVDENGNITGYGVDTAGVAHSFIWKRN